MRCPDSRCKEIMLLEEGHDLTERKGCPVVAETYSCTCGISVVVNTPANYEDRYHKDAS